MVKFGTRHSQGSLTMSTEFEQFKLLQVIKDNREVEELVKFHIPYPRILSHLRRALEMGLIQQAPDGQLVLTLLGERLVNSLAPQPNPSLVTDDLVEARTVPIDLDLVFLPKNAVGD